MMNRALIIPILKKTPYELYNGRKLNISHLHVFGCKCFVLNNDKENLGQFDAKFDEGIFLGYSLHGKTYRIYNKITMTIEESIHVSFDESNVISPRKDILDDVAESLEQMHIHGEDSKGKGKGSNEDPAVKVKANNDLPKSGKLQEIIPLTTFLVTSQKG